jgi:hypothetical protein
MPVVVHITDEKAVPSILRSGVLPRGRGVVYFMPVVQNHFVSHQWLRELRRSGAKSLVGVYVRLPSSEPVWAGKYHEQHKSVTLGQAIQNLNALSDPLGYEIFCQRRILPAEILRVRGVRQVVGWRYRPHSHGRELCGCPACLPRGAIKSRALRQRLARPVVPSLDTIRTRLSATVDPDEQLDCLWPLRLKRRKVDPSFLAPLLRSESVLVLEELAVTLPYLRHPESKRLLASLAVHHEPSVALAAQESLAAWSGARRSAA